MALAAGLGHQPRRGPPGRTVPFWFDDRSDNCPQRGSQDHKNPALAPCAHHGAAHAQVQDVLHGEAPKLLLKYLGLKDATAERHQRYHVPEYRDLDLLGQLRDELGGRNQADVVLSGLRQEAAYARGVRALASVVLELVHNNHKQTPLMQERLDDVCILLYEFSVTLYGCNKKAYRKRIIFLYTT